MPVFSSGGGGVTTVNVYNAQVGGNTSGGHGNGVELNAGNSTTLTVNVAGNATIGIGANYNVPGDGIHMYSYNWTGTTLSVSNAGNITAGNHSIYTGIIR